MAITKRRYDGVVFICDDCGEEHPQFTTDFTDAKDAFKDDGGTIKLGDGGDWHHYCKGCGE